VKQLFGKISVDGAYLYKCHSAQYVYYKTIYLIKNIPINIYVKYVNLCDISIMVKCKW